MEHELNMTESELPVMNHKSNNELLTVIRESSSNVNAFKKEMISVINDIKKLKGTRHQSAAAGSTDQAGTTVIRTNHRGLVSIFSNIYAR